MAAIATRPPISNSITARFKADSNKTCFVRKSHVTTDNMQKFSTCDINLCNSAVILRAVTTAMNLF